MRFLWLFGAMVYLRTADGVNNNHVGTLAEIMNYMSSYGYLEKERPGENRLRTADELRRAIEDLQAFLGVPVTGKLDDNTQNIIRQKRCGVPDIGSQGQKLRRKRYAFFPGRRAWTRKDLTWRLNRNSRSVGRDDAIRDLDDAFRLWSEASSLAFRRVEDQSTDVDIVISFEVGKHGDIYSFDGAGNTLAHAFAPSESPIGGDMHLDEDETWARHGVASQSRDRISVFMVAAHELGHSLGLAHSDSRDALMYPLYQGKLDLTGGLPHDDVYGIQTLYGAPTVRQPDRRPMPRTTAPTRETVDRRTRPTHRPHVPHVPQTTRYRPEPTPRPHPPRERPTHRPHRPHVPGQDPKYEVETVPTTTPTFPCSTGYDSVAIVREELFIFKAQHYWRMNSKRDTVPNGPEVITKFWTSLPANLDHVDAVYERPQKGEFNVVFFIGNLYWLFDGTTPIGGHPQPLTHLGLPRYVKKIDAAFVWSNDGNTYLFSEHGYWKFDEVLGRVEREHPTPMSEWPGLPDRIDAAVQWTDGAYVFKGRLYWELGDDGSVSSNPKLSAKKWMKCTTEQMRATGKGPRLASGAFSFMFAMLTYVLLIIY